MSTRTDGWWRPRGADTCPMYCLIVCRWQFETTHVAGYIVNAVNLASSSWTYGTSSNDHTGLIKSQSVLPNSINPFRTAYCRRKNSGKMVATSRRKALPPGDWSRSVCPALMQQRPVPPAVPDLSYIRSWYFNFTEFSRSYCYNSILASPCRLSVCLSVCLSVTLCIVALRVSVQR